MLKNTAAVTKAPPNNCMPVLLHEAACSLHANKVYIEPLNEASVLFSQAADSLCFFSSSLQQNLSCKTLINEGFAFCISCNLVCSDFHLLQQN